MAAKDLAKILARLAGLGAASLLLAECVTARQQAKTKADFQHYRSEEQELDNYQTCIDRGALPGSPQMLACQLDLAKKDQQPAKAPTPTNR